MGRFAKTVILAAIVAVLSCNVATVTASPEADAIRARVHEMQADLDNATVQLAKARDQAQAQDASLKTAQTQIQAVATERDGWKDYGNDQHDKWINAEKRVSDEKVWVYRLGIGLAILSFFCVAYGIGHFGYHILP